MDGEEEGKGMAALLRWAAEMGISDSPTSTSPPRSHSSCLGHSLFVSDFPDAGGRGLSAARDLRKGDLILRVPRAALLTSESVLKDERLASCVRSHPRLSSTQILTVCLLAEVGKGRGSQWYPYLVQLPRSYNTLANFTNFEIQTLQVEDAVWVSERAVHRAKSDWKESISLMQEMDLKPQLLTFRSWLWALSTISSRTLHIPWDNAGCLCPVGDLFNYAAPDAESSPDASEERYAEQPDCHSQRLTDGGYEEDTTSYCFYARKRYKEEDQVLLSYGTYTNLDLLEHYGFLLGDNPNDKAFIQLGTDICTSSNWPVDSLYIQPNGRPSFALLCALRLCATPVNHRRAVGCQVYAGSLLSVENELLVMKWLAKRCHDILEKLATTAEDDGLLLIVIEKMLYNPSCLKYVDLQCCKEEIKSFLEVHGLGMEGIGVSQLPMKARKSLERWKLAVRWRFGYKKMLISCISYCTNTIERLSSQQYCTKRNNQTGMPG
ncbi:protein SET DOMAIN GROUP 40 isoform X2 [Phoenix dactylifera]|uniref:Protein SET DOMAIN GROUP 40 isoform X2 n=1 Tax=Phoenix dactylifera TaxID=42345 RepID=A0A8B7CRT3_PHODC|nr:protein SET DOMAIN GROUP 40 isoform X2 [Phoenix dactylifera]